ncbi:L,D-transpeptidase family protein [Candidatus Dependentiae bacterium]|nr:L,D-transpeptidase family protein [Candidatus Dependentiae bacterium]
MLKKCAFIILILTGFFFVTAKQMNSKNRETFIEYQNGFERVKNARIEKNHVIKKYFDEKNVEYPPQKVFIRCFKKEKIVELWVKPEKKEKFIFLKDYRICKSSGRLGPKRKSGDMQVPEGFYFIERFNPVSNFYLSLGINYPNQSDKILGDKINPGGDIFIHGSDVTIGCIPLGDEYIKELYLVAIDVKSKYNENIQVHIFPCKMTDENMKNILEPLIKQDNSLKDFWQNIRTGYELFEKNRILFKYKVNQSGKYSFLK